MAAHAIALPWCCPEWLTRTRAIAGSARGPSQRSTLSTSKMQHETPLIWIANEGVLRVQLRNFETHEARLNCTTNYFSLRTPLKGLPFSFWSMNWPVFVSRLTQVSFLGLKVCDRSVTAPRRPGPFGGFVAMSSFSERCSSKSRQVSACQHFYLVTE